MELRKYWEIICRRKWVLIQALVLIPLFTYILFKIMSPIYKSEAKLMVKVNTLQQKFIRDMPAEIGKFEFINMDNTMGTIEALLESSFVNSKVIREMNLRDKNGELLKVDDFTDPNVIKLIFQKTGVGIDNISDSETFEITGYFVEPSKAKEISENVVKAFLDTFAKMYKEEAKKARKVIEYRLMDVEKRLKEAELALEDYRTKNKVFNIDTQVSTLIKNISDLEAWRNEALRSLQENKISIKTIKEASLSDQAGFKEAIAIIEDTRVIENYKSQLLSLEIELAKLIVERTQEHPDVKGAKNKIDAVKESIEEEISKSFASQIVGRTTFYDNLAIRYSNAVIDVVGLTARERILAEQIKEIQNRLNEIPGKEMKFNELSRKVDNLKITYNSLTLNVEATKSAQEMDLSNAFVFQPPTLFENKEDNLYFPPEKKTVLLTIATLVGIFLGIFLAFFLEYIDDCLWNQQDIGKTLNQKVIGIVPKVKKDELNIGKIEKSPIVDSIYNLLVNIKIFKGNEFGKVISFVSPKRKEGKSVLVALVASALAQQGKKVMLIDGNLRYSFIHNIFNLSNERGLGNYLLSNAEIKEITSSTSISNLDVITSGLVQIANPQRYLDSDIFSELVKTLITHYDIILLDTPAFENGSDALVISKYAEDIIFVLEQGKTPQKKAQSFMDTMNMAKFKVLGIVLNKVKYL